MIESKISNRELGAAPADYNGNTIYEGFTFALEDGRICMYLRVDKFSIKLPIFVSKFNIFHPNFIYSHLWFILM